MDDAARVPIVLEDDVAEVASQTTDGRGNTVTVEKDETLRIELPVAQPCEQAVPGEITVCASAPALDAEVEPPKPRYKRNPLELRLSDHASVAPGVSAGAPLAGGSAVQAVVTLKIDF